MAISRIRILAVLAMVALGGCSSFLQQGAGAVAGVATGSFTSNPAIGVAVSVGGKAATDAGVKNLLRSLQQDEQDEIAAIAGAMAPGDIRPWQVKNIIPYGKNQGETQVTRVIGSPLAGCKEIMFAVTERKAMPPHGNAPRCWFSANVCRQERRWKWAVAEPAVEPWGSLH